MREIRTLRARRRGLETELRITLHGHEGGNPGYGQGRSYRPPRQSSTLPASRDTGYRCTNVSHGGKLARSRMKANRAAECGV